ncbi:MAG: Asp-tRNA(Asn)/Glu-tRNA(Gln) amidotransferase subunit GatA [Myxococcota bacterium]
MPIGPDATLGELRRALESGETTAVALAEATLERVRATDGPLNAWLRTCDEQALEQAARVDAKREAGEPLGPLAGVPVGVKDLLCTEGVETTAASRILEGFVPPYDATAVKRLRDADAVVVGKLNMDEFAMGSSNENSAFGATRNPWDTERIPGGSSGGSAAAVAAGQVPLTLGTDTGGSIRQPASLCGVVGVKPTYGRVSRWGVVAFASSLDQVGPLARDVEGAAALLEAVSGHDPLDSTSIPRDVPSYTDALTGDVEGLRVGVPKAFFGEGLDEGVSSAVRESLARLESLGCELVEVELPHARYAVATYYLVATAEASSNLARYDGVRYGHRTDEPAREVADLYADTRAEGFGPEVKRRILLGTYALSSGYYDAYYLKAQKVRTLIRRDFEEAFRRCDVIAGPASPVTALRLGERIDDPLQMYLMDVYTIPASLAGLPGLSVPCGFDGGGLPVGLQLVGSPLEEGRLLRAAHAYEQATDFSCFDRAPGPVSEETPEER